MAALLLAGCLPASPPPEPASPAICRNSAPPERTARLRDDYDRYEPGRALADGERFGMWQVAFAGFGAVRVEDGPTGRFLRLEPRRPTGPATHAALVLGPRLSPPYELRIEVRTWQQLRVGDPPNPWEVGWVVWHYEDDEHFYYFVPKPNGWELGKRDPRYPGGQRMLATGETPRFPPGEWHQIGLSVAEREVAVSARGCEVVRHTDEEAPYRSGRIGLYTEDAAADFRRLRVY